MEDLVSFAEETLAVSANRANVDSVTPVIFIDLSITPVITRKDRL